MAPGACAGMSGLARAADCYWHVLCPLVCSSKKNFIVLIMALRRSVPSPRLQVYNLPWMPWPLPQPEMLNYCFAADLLEMQQGCVLFHMSSTEAPVRTTALAMSVHDRAFLTEPDPAVSISLVLSQRSTACMSSQLRLCHALRSWLGMYVCDSLHVLDQRSFKRSVCHRPMFVYVSQPSVRRLALRCRSAAAPSPFT